jgi:hypothetical protein
MANYQLDPNTRIAPKSDMGYWQVIDWQSAKDRKDWDTMIRIFRDRLNNRYLLAADELSQVDYHLPNRRLGFAIIALDCLFIETLHQFYKGYKDSKGDGNEIKGVVRKITKNGSNGQFFCEFLMKSSYVLKPHFEFQPGAAIIFYQDIRCGILHSGETQNATLIRVHKTGEDKNELFRVIGKELGIILYRDTFQRLLKAEFEEYCLRLANENEKQLRRNFVKKMGYVCGYDYGDGELE